MAASSRGILEGPNQTCLNSSGATIPANRLVKIVGAGSSNRPAIDVAGLADAAIGITKSDILNGNAGLVRLLCAPGTQQGTASATEAIAPGDKVYQAAAGKMTKANAGAKHLGVAGVGCTAAVDGDPLPFNVTPSEGIHA